MFQTENFSLLQGRIEFAFYCIGLSDGNEIDIERIKKNSMRFLKNILKMNHVLIMILDVLC